MWDTIIFVYGIAEHVEGFVAVFLVVKDSREFVFHVHHHVTHHYKAFQRMVTKRGKKKKEILV